MGFIIRYLLLDVFEMNEKLVAVYKSSEDGGRLDPKKTKVRLIKSRVR